MDPDEIRELCERKSWDDFEAWEQYIEDYGNGA